MKLGGSDEDGISGAGGEVWLCLQATVALGGGALGFIGDICWAWGMEESKRVCGERSEGKDVWGL